MYKIPHNRLYYSYTYKLDIFSREKGSIMSSFNISIYYISRTHKVDCIVLRDNNTQQSFVFDYSKHNDDLLWEYFDLETEGSFANYSLMTVQTFDCDTDTFHELLLKMDNGSIGNDSIAEYFESQTREPFIESMKKLTGCEGIILSDPENPFLCFYWKTIDKTMCDTNSIWFKRFNLAMECIDKWDFTKHTLQGNKTFALVNIPQGI